MMFISILLKASIMLVAAMVIHAVIGRHISAAARHLIWTLVVVGLLVLPVLSLLLPPWTALTRSLGPSFHSAGITPNLRGPWRENRTVQVSPSATAGTSKTAAISTSLSWPNALAGIYLAGITFVFFRFAAERRSIAQLIKRAREVTDSEWKSLLEDCAERIQLRKSVRLLRSRDETMPMALGIRRGTILIPAVADTWSEDRRQAVLLHEMSHLIRNDCLTQTLAAVACAFYWIHPGAWWVARRLRLEQELASDDRVLSVGANARDYSDHLLELAYSLRSGQSALIVTMAGSRQLEGRLLAVLDVARNRAVPARGSHIAGFAILIALMVPLAAATISGRKVAGKTSPGPLKLASFVQSALPLPAPEVPGTWEIRSTDRPGVVHVQLRESDGSYSTTIDLARVPGIPAGFPNVEGPVQFNVPREAGTFVVEGVIRNGIGAGTYAFRPSVTFANDLANRGFERPTPGEERMLARADIGLAFLDELATQSYDPPAHVAELVRAARSGVSLRYLQDMGRLGYHLGNLDTLTDLRSYGISAEFIQELAAEGLSNLPPDDLRLLRASGVDGEYVRGFRNLGYRQVSEDTLIQFRQHGVDPEYVRGFNRLGYQGLSSDRLIELRNHGVDPQYASEFVTLGYTKLPLDTLIELRNHGVDPNYTRNLSALGYPKLSLDTLIELRNHGVDPEYVGEFQSLGYSELKIEDFVRMRNAGLSSEQVLKANARAGKTLSVDALIELSRRGWQ